MSNFSQFLSQRQAQLDQAELQEKVAAVNSVWGNDPERLADMEVAYGIVKQAMANGTLPATMTNSNQFSLVVDLVEQAQQVKQAQQNQPAVADETTQGGSEPDAIEVDSETASNIHKVAFVLGRHLRDDAGVTVEDLEKCGEQELVVLGQYLGTVFNSLVK